MQYTGTPTEAIPHVASRLMRPNVGPWDLPGTSLGSSLTPSPLKG